MTSGFHTGITRSETLHARLPQTVLLPCLASSVSFFFTISLILTRCRHRVRQVLLSQRLFMPGCPRLPSSMSSPLFFLFRFHTGSGMQCFLIALFAVIIVFIVLISSGARFHSLVASPRKLFLALVEVPNSIHFPLVKPLVSLPFSCLLCLSPLTGYSSSVSIFHISVNLI